MDVLAFLAVTALLAGVVWIVARPLRGGAAATASDETAEIEDLLAAREAKYREIRELDLDHDTGKLSDEDHRAQARVLRAEAIEILKRLDALGFAVDDDSGTN